MDSKTVIFILLLVLMNKHLTLCLWVFFFLLLYIYYSLESIPIFFNGFLGWEVCDLFSNAEI